MSHQAFFVASTGQHVGKTTTCLGLVSGMKKRFKDVGFLKPLGQETLLSQEGVLVDKDVILFKDYFGLQDPYEMMSPVVFSKGFTKDFLNGEISLSDLKELVNTCYHHLCEHNQALIVEGTGHVGVGSIAYLNNAEVASLLNIPMVLIASGGIGSCFDSLALNKGLCDLHGAKIAGVILNKVVEEKKEMIVDYMQKSLKRWDLPLLGVIPYDAFLSNPTFSDYATLFKQEILSGDSYKLRHFKHRRLIATSVEVYETLIVPSQLIITPASREDIILATLAKQQDLGFDLEGGMILTGMIPPKPFIIEKLKKAGFPTFYTPTNTFNTMIMISSYTSKLRKEDLPRVHEAIKVVEAHVDFDLLLNRVSKC